METIPLFDLNYGQEELEAVVQPLKDNWISMGPKVQEFEDEFKEMLGAKYAIAVTNCTAALHMAAYVLGIKMGEEVICPSLTFVATANSIRYVGGTPVFCDVTSESNLGMDVDLIESLITDKTRAIVPMHYAGFPCNMDRIMEIARKYGLVVIEDACHGPLSEYKGRKLGTIGDVGCFSFYSNKNISTGEGGMIVTNDKEVYEKCKLIRSHGMTTVSYERATGKNMGYDVEIMGFNYRMDDIRASLGLAQLKKLNTDIERRAEVRRFYENELIETKELTIPYLCHSEKCSNYIFPVVLKNSTKEKREQIRCHLKEKGIQTSVHYPAVHRFEYYHDEKRSFNLPKTEYIVDNEISLPMYGKLTQEQVKYICDTLKEALAGY